MRALDTNVLVRFLVCDDLRQAEQARALIEEAERQRTPLWIGVGVVLECLWVLESVYRRNRADILDALAQLRMLAGLTFEMPAAVDEFCRLGRTGTVELDDLWLAVLAKQKGCETLLTFDRKAARLPLCTLIR